MTLLEQHNAYIQRLKERGAKTAVYKTPCCGNDVEDRLAEKGEKWDTMCTCAHCGTSYFKVASDSGIVGMLVNDDEGKLCCPKCDNPFKKLKNGDEIDVFVLTADKTRIDKVRCRRADDLYWGDGRVVLQAVNNISRTYCVECKYPAAWLTFDEAKKEAQYLLQMRINTHKQRMQAVTRQLNKVMRQQEPKRKS
jgi:Zn finger protein HypA/HybF involved in hydrogenase expression